jgi:Mg2+ and Co2+ transporter CorA
MEREELEHRLMKIESTIFAGKDVDVKEFYTLKKELIENKPFQNDLLELFLILEAMLDKQHNDLLNKRLNLLTIWSTIFLPLSFYTGIFGMNFDDVPFLNNHHGFWIFTVLTIGTAIVMYFYFKRNKWI